jgi:hypothetical protein
MPEPDLPEDVLEESQGDSEIDDDPVIVERRHCADCSKSGVPLDENDRCDDCAERYSTLIRRNLDWESTDNEEITFQFMVDITIPVRGRNSLDVCEARLRANEILMGMPMVSDKETWSHDLIGIVDENGNEVPYNPDKD